MTSTTPVPGLERQQVHATAVPVVIEADLGSHAPTRRRSANAAVCSSIDGMRGVKQPIELFALPSNRDVDGRSQGLGDALDRPERHAANEAALDPRDGRPGHGGPGSEIRLTPTLAAAEMANGTRQVRTNHRRMMSWPLTRRLRCGVMTYEELLALARRFEGETLETVTGKPFTVGIYLDCPFFTPASSGYGQSDGRKAAERFLAALQRDRQPPSRRLCRCHAQRLLLRRPGRSAPIQP